MVTASMSVDPGAHVPVPSLSQQQRVHATATATAARRSRAAAKRRLKQGDATVEEVIADASHDPAIAKLKVRELLESMPGIGEVKAGQIMVELHIARSRRVRGLGSHQTQALVERFQRS